MTAKPLASSEDRVRAIAHKLWVDEGMPEGRADAHWLQALEIANADQQSALRKVAVLKAKSTATAAKKKPAAAAAKKASPAKRG